MSFVESDLIVMECTEFLDVRRTILQYGKRRRKFFSVETTYAGLIVFFVPLVICDPGWSHHLHQLTFDEIYNRTNYVQLQYTPRPYDLPFSFKPNSHRIDYRNRPEAGQTTQESSIEIYRPYNHIGQIEDFRENELDEDYVRGDIKEPLLVGFAHDPFRYSVPEEDYLKGVRNMNPKTIMSKGENRGKRGVLHLYNMMYCATGCEPLAYKGYGCYCGFLGSGKPTDGIDRCCKIHDDCYENIFCPFYTVYFQPYYWKCHRGQPLCALENYNSQHQFINGCAARLCECDRKFAMCVKKYPCPRRRALCRSSPIRLLQNLLMFR